MSVSLTLDEYNKLFTKSRLVVVAQRKVADLEEHITELKKLNAILAKQLKIAEEQQEYYGLIMAIKSSLHDEKQRQDRIASQRFLEEEHDEEVFRISVDVS